MKKVFLALVALVALFVSGSALAADSWTYKNALTLHVPWEEFGPVAIYDLRSDEIVVGAEVGVVSFPRVKNLWLTVGAVTDASFSNDGELRERAREFLKSGTGFAGVRYDLVSLLPGLFDNRMHVGFAAGWNFEEGKELYGIKTTYVLSK